MYITFYVHIFILCWIDSRIYAPDLLLQNVYAYRSLDTRTMGNSLASAPSELWRLATLNGACLDRNSGSPSFHQREAPHIGQKNDGERRGMGGGLLLQAGDAAKEKIHIIIVCNHDTGKYYYGIGSNLRNTSNNNSRNDNV
ncbi:hypothetical protein G5I_03087 [Acromyrmex echinatior]|uniref:Uncharacterized protein n=1 Tax=Acromyrmex echinatior TaxID=103372 RepID=F4WC15_ACREC|nr:hypothetical protein G5I_03087 [Acromyrmex echinatior]